MVRSPTMFDLTSPPYAETARRSVIYEHRERRPFLEQVVTEIC